MNTDKPKAKFDYVQSPHIEARKKYKNSGESGLTSVNDRIASSITKGVGTMWAAYIFFGLTLVSLPAVLITGDPVLIVSWVAQTFLQLVLLPIIIVGQNLQARAAEKRAILTYEDADAVLQEAVKIQKHLDHQDQALTHLIERIEVLETKLLKK